MEKELSVRLFKEKLDSLDDSEKAGFMEEYMRENSQIPLDLLAFIYESLGEMHRRAKNPKESFFEKAASTWEMVSVLNADGEKSKKRYALEKALENYQRAFRIYKKRRYFDGVEETREKIAVVRRELSRHGGYGKIASIIGIFVIFFFSFVFLSSPPTGFVITPLDTGETTVVGFVLALTAIIGMFFVLLRWR